MHILNCAYLLPTPSNIVLVTTADGKAWTTRDDTPEANPVSRRLAEWVDAGGVITPYAPPPATLADYQRAIEAHVEGTAHGRGYTSAATCAGYVASGVGAWKAEADAFVAWRDAVYVATFAELAAVEGGETPPSVAEFIASMPAIVWPV